MKFGTYTLAQSLILTLDVRGYRAFDEWLNKIKADVWDERGRTLASYLGPDNGHEWDCMGYGDCYCATYPNPYRKDANG